MTQFFYDHLGQRVLKVDYASGDTVTRIFVYDIFGNMLGEVETNVNPINTYIYLGNHRLVLIAGNYSGTICGLHQGLGEYWDGQSPARCPRAGS